MYFSGNFETDSIPNIATLMNLQYSTSTLNSSCKMMGYNTLLKLWLSCEKQIFKVKTHYSVANPLNIRQTHKICASFTSEETKRLI